jgi:bifunctional DNA-binding transcriptional regulator/antitoxin component of YhaV-PrlF toxin-antitoxin module
MQISSKGQITIPQQICLRLGLLPHIRASTTQR